MTLQSSGLITMDDIVAEFGGTKPYFINQYYRNGSRVPSSQSKIPASGLIKFSDFYDSTAIVYAVDEFTPGTSYYTVPKGITNIKVNLIGGGGGGGGNIEWGDSWRGGGGGAGTDQFGTIIPVTPLEVLTVVVGLHGLRGVYQFNGNYIGGTADSTGTSSGSAGGNTYILRGTTVLAKAGGGGGGQTYGVAGATGVNSVAAGVTMGGLYQTITPAVGGNAMNDFYFNEGGKNYTGYGDGGRSNRGYPGNDGAYSGIDGHMTIISGY